MGMFLEPNSIYVIRGPFRLKSACLICTYGARLAAFKWIEKAPSTYQSGKRNSPWPSPITKLSTCSIWSVWVRHPIRLIVNTQIRLKHEIKGVRQQQKFSCISIDKIINGNECSALNIVKYSWGELPELQVSSIYYYALLPVWFAWKLLYFYGFAVNVFSVFKSIAILWKGI